jgi:hypothetical protein
VIADAMKRVARLRQVHVVGLTPITPFVIGTMDDAVSAAPTPEVHL